MASLFDIGKTAVQAQRQALNVTGQNIANVNTDGYRKRSADLNEVSGSQSGLTSITSQIGLGVNLSEVRRAYNVFLASSTNSSQSRFESSQTFVESMERLENAILPGEGDLSSQISQFFLALSDVEASPGDLAPRAAAIEQGNGLANAFNVTAFVLRDLEAQITGAIDQEVSEVNRLLSSLGSVNGKLRSSNLGASPPNALMDERDRLIAEVSKKVRISVNYGPRHDVNVRLGEHLTGPLLLDGETAQKIQPIYGEKNGVSYRLGSSTVIKVLDDGGLRGLSTALSVIQDTHTQVDTLADRMINEVNIAHRNGIDFDGQFGRSMFTAREFLVEPALENSGPLDVSVLTVPGLVDGVSDATFRYNGRSGAWEVYDNNNKAIGTGRNEINLSGAIVRVENQAVHGDSFTLKKMNGEADRLSFLLTDGRQIAAASNFVITPNSSNAGAATMVSEAAVMAPPDLASITDVTNNSLSSVAYTEFLNGGAVAYIPAGVKNLNLASLGQDPNVTLNFNDLNELRGFNFVIGSDTYEVAVSKSTVNSLRDCAHLADYLNNGFLTVTKKNSGGATIATGLGLQDLGLFAAGFEGGLKITGSSSFTSGKVTIESNGTVTDTKGVVKSAEDASNFRVFTREGRQVAGIPLSSNEADLILTESNGFTSQAEYRADYLNPLDGIGYRGATINNILPGGYSTVTSAASILTAGSTSSLIKQGAMFNTIAKQTLSFQTTAVDSNGTATATTDDVVNVNVSVDAGVNMKTIADDINIQLEPYGFVAEARTYASLKLANGSSPSGDISFSLASGDKDPVSISGIFGNSDLSPLVSKINQRSVQTGITAEVSGDGSRIVLVQADGKDISITNVTGQALTVNSLDQNFNDLLASDVALNQNTKIIGSLSLRSPRAFKMGSSLDASSSAFSQTFSKEEGGVSETLSRAGTVSELSIDIAPELLEPQSSPDGLRLAAANTLFTLSGKMNGSSADTDIVVNSNSLSNVSVGNISKTLLTSFRSTSALPSLTGAPISSDPADGSTISVLVGASQYDIRYASGEFVVQGPESGRVLAEIQTTGTGTSSDPYIDRFVINVPGGVLNGRSIEILDGGDLAEFGLAKSETTATSGIKSRAFSDFTLVSAAKLNGTSSSAISLSAVNDTLSFSGGSWNNSDAITVTLGGVTETITIAADTYANTNAGVATQVKAELDALIAAGTLSNISITDNGAGVLSFAKTFNSMVGSTDTTFSVRHVNSAASAITGAGTVDIVAGAEYTVSDASVVYNGATYVVGTTFTGVDSVKTATNAVTSGGVANGKVTVASGFAITSSNSAVTPTISADGSSYIIGLDLAYYKSDGSLNGPLRITPSEAAGALGFGTADFSMELTETGIKTSSYSGEPSNVSLSVNNLTGQVLTMTGLPSEDFIVLLDSNGAKRLSSDFEMNSTEDEKAQRDYRVKVVDAAAGRVELFDVETGTSMATRFTNGVVEFEANDYRFELAGFGNTGDYFDIALNRSNAGDARNMVAMVALSRTTAERSSFQDDFRNIALMVGSQLESGRLLSASATAIRDAAIATEDELSGVNLDEEAGKLMEQQQAYKAAAQILQTARDLFDAIIRIM
ncbi:flagellar hook-associated protein FlgK [Rhodobacteraceae bacterium IMCC15231]|nr:flagellar hook-associated protein FlgK [Rhodobacteraceae bacterium IMCC15231]